MCYAEDPLVVISISSWVGNLMLVMLAIKFGTLDRVSLMVEMGSGVGEWGKQCGGFCFCGPCVCLSIFLLL
jgi:hypothetical protein